MLDVMYDLPSLKGIRRCRVTADTVLRRSAPLLLTGEDGDTARRRGAQSRRH